MLEKQVALPSIIWNKLNLSWVGFFLLMGCLNLYVAFNFSVDSWVTFKLFGSTGLMLIFIILQVMMMGKYIKEAAPELVNADESVSEQHNSTEKISK